MAAFQAARQAFFTHICLSEGSNTQFPENLHKCRHTKQANTAAALDRVQPSKAASDCRDQDASQAPSPIVPTDLPASETPTEAMVEAPVQISKEDRIAAAREKYLARKRQKMG